MKLRVKLRVSIKNHSICIRFIRAVLVLFTAINTAHASLLAFQGQYGSELEEQAAISNQRVYDELKALGCTDTQVAATTNCDAGSFRVWNGVRELVHTANELNNTVGGPTLFSLDSDLEGLGFALRWTAGEEFSTQESMSDSFVNGQLSGLSSRVTALTRGMKGFALASNYFPGISQKTLLASDALWLEEQKGGGASGDTDKVLSPWGGFFNTSYTYGDQDASDFEDAYDFVGYAYSGGVDYRLSPSWVVGVTMGYSEQDIAFDANKSIVEGTVDMTAYSLMPFLLFQADSLFATVSAGYQVAEFETERFIRYPSFNPNVSNTDTIAVSDNDADIVTVTGSVGYSYTPSRFAMLSIDPYLSINYQRTSIGEYTEQDIKNEGFAFTVDKQNLESFESVLGLRVQGVASFGWGVLVPFVDVQFFTEHNTGDHKINAIYADANDSLTDVSQFSLETNGTELSYNIYAVGVSAVVRGTTYTTGNGAAGGIQVYFSYRSIENIQDYTQHILAGGARYEF